MKKCCCCSTRTACKVFSVLGMIDCIYKIGNDIKEIMKAHTQSDYQKEQDIDEVIEGFQILNMPMKKSSVEEFLSVSLTAAYFDILVAIIGIIAYGCLFYGVFKEAEKFLLPSLCFIPLDFLKAAGIIIAYSATIGFGHPMAFALNMITVVNIVILVPVWLCIYSYKQQLKEEHLNKEDYSMANPEKI